MKVYESLVPEKRHGWRENIMSKIDKHEDMLMELAGNELKRNKTKTSA